MRTDSEIKRYGKIVVIQHWLAILVIFSLIFTGLVLVRDWFIREFNVYGAENYVPTPGFASFLHLMSALAILFLGAIHLVVHGGQKEKPILPKNSIYELKQALYSLLFLVFLTKKQERGSGEKYLRSQRIIYAFTIYVLGLAAITGFLSYTGLLGEYMLNSHIVAGILLILVAVHRMALVIRRHDRVALRSVLATGTMPMWYVRKNHKIWYEEIVGRGASEIEAPVEIRKKQRPPAPKTMKKQIPAEKIGKAGDAACIIEDNGTGGVKEESQL